MMEGIGTIIALLLFVCTISAIIRAIATQQKKWIIIACAGCAVFASFYAVDYFQSSRGALGPKPTPSAPPRAAPAPAAQSVTGDVLKYTFSAPAGWTVNRDQSTNEVFVNNRVSYMSFGAQTKSDRVTSEMYARATITQFRGTATEVRSSDPEPERIDGRQWQRLLIDCTMKGDPMTFVIFCYAGPEGIYRIQGWTKQPEFSANRPQIESIARSFRFPP